MNKHFFTIGIAVLAALLVPQNAHAWGGGMHLQVGLKILENLAILPAAIAGPLAGYPRDFLYGCLAADITLGKKYTHYLLNCHRWAIGRKVLQSASTEGEQACAYGYLCHLAADTIAHNCFVPYKIMQTFPTVTMKHAYWEMRFETFIGKDVWDMAKDVCRSDQRANDVLLRSVLTPTIFSFGTNKRIFNSIMLLSRLERWQRVMQTLSDNSRYQLTLTEHSEYFKLTEDAALEFMQNLETSKLLLTDPTGERTLAMAEAVRKNLRLLYKTGRMTKQDGMKQVDFVRNRLQQALHDQSLLEEFHNG